MPPRWGPPSRGRRFEYGAEAGSIQDLDGDGADIGGDVKNRSMGSVLAPCSPSDYIATTVNETLV